MERAHSRQVCYVEVGDIVSKGGLSGDANPSHPLTDSPKTFKARRTWVETYRQTGNAGLTCRRCGISRPTPSPTPNGLRSSPTA